MHKNANFAPRFIEVFWNFRGAGVLKYLAIDEDRVRLDIDGSIYVELDTWFGARFNKDIAIIPSGLVKLRPPLDLSPIRVEFFFASAYCLDIRWDQEGSIKTFQALELKAENVTVEVNGEQFHPARYLHAEYDTTTRTFRHFDGAVQLYKSDEYLVRRDSDFNYNLKSVAQIKARSKKLFKLNGALQVDEWVELCCHS